MKTILSTTVLVTLISFFGKSQCECYAYKSIDIVGTDSMEIVFHNTCDYNVYLKYFVISTVAPFDTLANSNNYSGAVWPFDQNVPVVIHTNLTTMPSEGAYRVGLTNNGLHCPSLPLNPTLSIPTLIDNNEIQVFPNPATDVLNFSQPTDVELYSNNGQLITSERQVNQLSVKQFPVGNYLVILTNDKGLKKQFQQIISAK